MTEPSIREAVAEAQRFISRAEEALAAVKEVHGYKYCIGSEFAAARRASLDLTKALARMRKSI